MSMPLVKGKVMQRSRGERAFIAAVSLLALVTFVFAALSFAGGEPFVGAANTLTAFTATGIVVTFRRATPLGGYRGRAMWLGSLSEFVDLFDDGNPFDQWGITGNQQIEVRVMHDDIDAALSAYLPPGTRDYKRFDVTLVDRAVPTGNPTEDDHDG